MPTAPDGYTRIEDAVAKWGRNRSWWYTEVREGRLTGYDIPGLRGTYLRDDEVVAHLAPKPKESGASDTGTQVG